MIQVTWSEKTQCDSLQKLNVTTNMVYFKSKHVAFITNYKKFYK